jgi:hypothetical protein
MPQKPSLVFKGNSRCYVFEESHIKEVEAIIKEISEFEFGYMPENWVTLFTPSYNDDLVYNGKFDIDVIELKIACAKKQIAIHILSTNIDDGEY